MTASAQGTGLIQFDHYHTLDEIGTYLETVAASYPQLVTLDVIGRSREGRPIWAVDVNNPATGPASEKPGFYVDGNIHGGEVLGGEGALAFLDRIVGAHGNDAALTELLDGRAFYIVPIVNPDGRAITSTGGRGILPPGMSCGSTDWDRPSTPDSQRVDALTGAVIPVPGFPGIDGKKKLVELVAMGLVVEKPKRAKR